MIFRPILGGPARPIGPAPVEPGLPVRTMPMPVRGPMQGPAGTLGRFKKGGKVKKTGKYMLEKGEHVVPKLKSKKKVRLIALMDDDKDGD